MRERDKITLFCFPYGGGGTSVYRPWAGRLLKSHIEVVPVQFPGRDERFKEKSLLNIADLVIDSSKTIKGHKFESFAFFGHSLGALVAFELARYLRCQSPGPLALFASGFPAPHLPRNRPLISHLPKSAFIDILRTTFGLSEALASDPLAMEYAFPALLADFRVVEGYRYEPAAPLDCTIATLSGSVDREATGDQMLEWQQHTSKPLRSAVLHGGHFFIHTEQESVLTFIDAILAEIRGCQ